MKNNCAFFIFYFATGFPLQSRNITFDILEWICLLTFLNRLLHLYSHILC